MGASMIKYAGLAGAVLFMSAAALAFGPGHGGPGAGGSCPGMGSGGGMGRGAGMGPGFGWHAQALGLNTEQQKQVTALESKLEADVAPLRAQIATKRTELQALWNAPAPDRKAILAKQAEMEPLREKIRTAQIDFHLSVQKVLTPEQREAWTKMRGAGPWGGGRGPGGGGFGGSDMPCGGNCPQSW